ncbi:MAG: NUDIX hydrolase [Anaerolineae bacterium]
MATPLPRPTVAVGGIVVDNNRILLIQRGHAPNKGLWTVPGGRVEWGETVREAVVREVREETGLSVELGPLVVIVDRMSEPDAENAYHFIILDFLARLVGGALQAGDDAAAARWVTPGEWQAMPTTEGLGPVLDKALRMAAIPDIWEKTDYVG